MEKKEQDQEQQEQGQVPEFKYDPEGIVLLMIQEDEEEEDYYLYPTTRRYVYTTEHPNEDLPQQRKYEQRYQVHWKKKVTYNLEDHVLLVLSEWGDYKLYPTIQGYSTTKPSKEQIKKIQEEQDQEQEEITKEQLIQCMKSWVDNTVRDIPTADHPLYFKIWGPRKQDWELVTCSSCTHPRLLHNIMNVYSSKDCWRVSGVLSIASMHSDYERLIFSSETIAGIINQMREKCRKPELKQELEKRDQERRKQEIQAARRCQVITDLKTSNSISDPSFYSPHQKHKEVKKKEERSPEKIIEVKSKIPEVQRENRSVIIPSRGLAQCNIIPSSE